MKRKDKRSERRAGLATCVDEGQAAEPIVGVLLFTYNDTYASRTCSRRFYITMAGRVLVFVHKREYRL